MKNILKLEVVKGDKPLFDCVRVDGVEYYLKDKMEINLVFNDIEKEFGSKIVSFVIKEKKSEKIHNFEVLQGENYGILSTSHGKTRDLIFRENDQVEFEIGNNKEIKNNLTCHNGVKRLLLINLSYDIPVTINGEDMTEDLIDLANEKSLQVSVVDLKNRVLPYKKITDNSLKDFLAFFKSYNQDMDEFRSFIKKHLELKDIYSDEVKQKFNDLQDIRDIFFIKFNLSTAVLKKYYNEAKYFEFASLCSLFHVLNAFIANELSVDKIKGIYDLFSAETDKIQGDKSLENYQKIIIILEMGLYMAESGDPEKFKQLNFTYYLINNFQPDSIGSSAIEFLKSFIDGLNEKSPFYFPLTLIDSGSFTYNGDCVYGQGLLNNKMLVAHLRDVFPEVLCTYFDEEDIDLGLTNKASGCVTVNLAPIFESVEKINIDKKVENKDVRENYSLKLVISLFHEIFGHKKTGYFSEVKSPYRFFDKEEKKLMILRHKNSLDNGENIIKILRNEKSKHDSGHFLEYFFGKCKSGFIIDLLEVLLFNNIDMKFLHDSSLFNENICVLRKYVELKYLVFKENRELFKSFDCKTIEEEINALEKIIEDKKIVSIGQENKPNLSPKLVPAKSPKKQVVSIGENLEMDYNYYIEKSSEEIREKMKDKNISPALREMLMKLLLGRIRKK